VPSPSVRVPWFGFFLVKTEKEKGNGDRKKENRDKWIEGKGKGGIK
jgi:hypothetical protein